MNRPIEGGFTGNNKGDGTRKKLRIVRSPIGFNRGGYMKLQYSKILSLCLLVTLFWGNKADAGFMNGTLVAVPDQYGEVLLVPIEKLEVGDVILGEDPVEGIVPVIIKRIEERPIKYFIHISISPNRYFSCNRYISSTEDQLYCEYRDKGNNQWKEIAAINLKKGDILSASSLGKHVNAKVVNIRETSWLFFHSNPCAYFLDVDRTHNFFVSDFEQRFDYKAMTFHSNEKLLYAQTMKLNITDIGIQNFEAVSKKLCSVLHTRGKDHMTILVHNAIPAYIAQVGSIFETTEFLKAEGEAVGSCVGNMAVGLAVILSNLDGKSAEFINLSKISGEVDQNNIHDDYIQAEYDHIKRQEQKRLKADYDAYVDGGIVIFSKAQKHQQLKAEYNSHTNTSIHGSSGGGMTGVKSHRRPRQSTPTKEDFAREAINQKNLNFKYHIAPSIHTDTSDFGIVEINGEYCPIKNGIVRYGGKYYSSDEAKKYHDKCDKKINENLRNYKVNYYPGGIKHVHNQDAIKRDAMIKEKTEREAAIKQYVEEKMSANPTDVDRIARSINDGSYKIKANIDVTHTSNTDSINISNIVPNINITSIPNTSENIKDDDDEDILLQNSKFNIKSRKTDIVCSLPIPELNKPIIHSIPIIEDDGNRGCEFPALETDKSDNIICGIPIDETHWSDNIIAHPILEQQPEDLYHTKEDNGEDPDPKKKTECEYVDATKRGSTVQNVDTDATREEVEQQFQNDTWNKDQKPGPKNIVEYINKKDGSKYVLRDDAKSTGEPTLDYYKSGSKTADIKIRLEPSSTNVANSTLNNNNITPSANKAVIAIVNSSVNSNSLKKSIPQNSSSVTASDKKSTSSDNRNKEHETRRQIAQENNDMKKQSKIGNESHNYIKPLCEERLNDKISYDFTFYSNKKSDITPPPLYSYNNNNSNNNRGMDRLIHDIKRNKISAKEILALEDIRDYRLKDDGCIIS